MKKTNTKENNEIMEIPAEEAPYELPEGWKWVRLGMIANWGSGGTPSRRIEEFYKGQIPWVKTGELNNKYIFDTEEHISENAIKNSNAKLYPINTVLVAMYGATIGKVGILGVEATTNQACACGICKENISYKFLFHYLLFSKEAFIKMAKGGAQPNISHYFYLLKYIKN